MRNDLEFGKSESREEMERGKGEPGVKDERQILNDEC